MDANAGDVPEADLHQVARTERDQHRQDQGRRRHAERGELEDHERGDERVAEDGTDRCRAAEKATRLDRLLVARAAQQQHAECRAEHDQRCLRTERDAEDQRADRCEQDARHDLQRVIEVEARQRTRARVARQALRDQHDRCTDQQHDPGPPPWRTINAERLGHRRERRVLQLMDGVQEGSRANRADDADNHGDHQ